MFLQTYTVTLGSLSKSAMKNHNIRRVRSRLFSLIIHRTEFNCPSVLFFSSLGNLDEKGWFIKYEKNVIIKIST
jgi:hypothetical protein